MKIIVDLTGPDHEPTVVNKWYAQAFELPLHVSQDYDFGPTPHDALANLITRLEKEYGIILK